LLTRVEVLGLLKECRLIFQDPAAFDKWQRGAFFPHNPYEQRGKAFVSQLAAYRSPLQKRGLVVCLPSVTQND